MYLLIAFLPLMGCFIAGFFGRAIGPHGAQIVTITGVGLAACLSWFAFYEVGLCGSPCYLHLGTWMDSELFYVSWGLMLDAATVSMLILVTTVSTLVHVYAVSYMSADPHIPRFMAYLSFFTFFMICLVTADNLIQLFFGWEGIGLCSYLLINFWYTRLQANKAAIKAVLVNRVGDFGLALGIMGVFFLFQSVDFATMFSVADSFYTPENVVGEGYQLRHIFFMGEWNSLDLVCVLLFVGVAGKSAQLGLHTWLPDAMEGPTPVSALIHAATLVTAGVFLIIRCSPLFEYAPNALLVVTFFGAMTAFFAATTGLLQNDLKRVIAYSTCSQLGYMVFACGISNYSVSLFHLVNHGFFKALLFLSAGSVIHALTDEQDMRQMGGLAQMIPYTYVMITIGSLSLMGFPFMTGFYSKDVILELAYSKYSLAGSFAHWLGSLAAFFTAFYSFRLVALTFLVKTNAQKTRLSHVHDAPFFLGFPLFCLAFGSIFFGYLMKDMMIGLGTPFWNQAIFIAPHNMNMVDAEFIPTIIKWVPVILSFIGAGSALVAYGSFTHILYRMKIPSNPFEATYVPHTRSLGNHMYSFLNQKWYVDKIYNSFLVVPALQFGYNVSFRLLDRGVFEMLGPYGLRESFSALSYRTSQLQTGYLYNYAFVMLLGVTLFLAFGAIQTFGFVLVPYREFAFLVAYLLWLIA